MTTAAIITALEALTADAVQSADDAQLARLEELGTALARLVDGEKERRNPTDTKSEVVFNEAWKETGRETTQKRMAVYRAQRDARRATIKEAIEYCASNPVLHERMKAVFWAEMSISAGSAT